MLVAALAAICAWIWTRSTPSRPPAIAVLVLATDHPQQVFPLGAAGLSIEPRELSTGYLTARHPRLVRLMRLLGPSTLRIGGSSEDYSWWTSKREKPAAWATNEVTPDDLFVLHHLLSVTGWRAVLGVNFGHFEPARAADEAHYAKQILGVDLLGIEIGNEPDGFRLAGLRPEAFDVTRYTSEAEIYRQAVSTAAPGVGIYGPAMSATRWLTQMGSTAQLFTEVTQHFYPINRCPETLPPYPEPTSAALLSPAVRQRENEVLEELVDVVHITSRPVRLGETNSIGCNRRLDASPKFAGALWALDWVLRSASRGVVGLNFHGGFGYFCSPSENQICAPNERAARTGYVTAQAEYYGLLASRQLEGGRFIPTHLADADQLPNLTTWATLASNGVIRVAIDNFAMQGSPQHVLIPVSGYSATSEALEGPAVEATNGITFAGVRITDAGEWRPRPSKLSPTFHDVSVAVSPASAVIVTLRPQRADKPDSVAR